MSKESKEGSKEKSNPKSKKWLYALIGLAVVAVAAIGIYLSIPKIPSQVTISGTVTTLGAGTHPTGIKFADTSSGQIFTLTVVGNSYSIALPNQKSYRITVSWSGLLGASGNTDAGILNVNIGAGVSAAMIWNISC